MVVSYDVHEINQLFCSCAKHNMDTIHGHLSRNLIDLNCSTPAQPKSGLEHSLLFNNLQSHPFSSIILRLLEHSWFPISKQILFFLSLWIIRSCMYSLQICHLHYIPLRVTQVIQSKHLQPPCHQCAINYVNPETVSNCWIYKTKCKLLRDEKSRLCTSILEGSVKKINYIITVQWEYVRRQEVICSTWWK